ncbi:uncharacterized protein LOC132295803 [Cornus florida]|uniref:uncharacterized protein LOC132295803 n=1 Tax=Cornus florida TaxID=4283 RepID=UPI0028990288|nr:uncharacterized protein LOC132295803 [Cornus florida]
MAVWKLSPFKLDFSISSPSSWPKRWLFIIFLWDDCVFSSECISLAAFICWALWKCHNDLLFNNKLWDPLAAVQLAVRNFHEFTAVSFQDALLSLSPATVPPRSSSWIPLALGAFKLNFDATYSNVSKSCGSGIILKNHFGQPIRVASVFFRFVCSSSVTEALVLRESLTLLQCWGYSHVLVEGDCKPVMDLFPSEEARTVIYDNATILLRSCLGSSLGWTHRLGNVVAHLVSKSALEASCGDFEWSI